jgi:hypothetical protein
VLCYSLSIFSPFFYFTFFSRFFKDHIFSDMLSYGKNVPNFRLEL